MRKAWVLMAGMAAYALTSGAPAAAAERLSDAQLDGVTAGAVLIQIVGAAGVQTFNLGPAAFGGQVVVNLLTNQTTGFITNNGVVILNFGLPQFPPLPGQSTARSAARTAAAPQGGLVLSGGGVTLELSSTSSYSQ